MFKWILAFARMTTEGWKRYAVLSPVCATRLFYNPSIGLILCKTKDQVLAEYALRDVTKPIGLAEYRLTEALPENIKTALPTIEELEAELSKDFIEIQNGVR